MEQLVLRQAQRNNTFDIKMCYKTIFIIFCNPSIGEKTNLFVAFYEYRLYTRSIIVEAGNRSIKPDMRNSFEIQINCPSKNLVAVVFAHINYSLKRAWFVVT